MGLLNSSFIISTTAPTHMLSDWFLSPLKKLPFSGAFLEPWWMRSNLIKEWKCSIQPINLYTLRVLVCIRVGWGGEITAWVEGVDEWMMVKNRYISLHLFWSCSPLSASPWWPNTQRLLSVKADMAKLKVRGKERVCFKSSDKEKNNLSLAHMTPKNRRWCYKTHPSVQVAAA